ncbi:hypothetical protein, partial [Brevibacillus laterosporus]|uniref:hypothetical protein n=1 Tax=Brevibacillus laterosporus TaxID=1465 RepID=UPI002656C6F2
MANLLTPNQSSGATGTEGLEAIDQYSQLARVTDAGVTGGTAVRCSSMGKIDGFAVSIRSTKIPVIEGKEYEFIVWLKKSELVGRLKSHIYWYKFKKDSWGEKIGTTYGVNQSSGNDKGIYYKFIARGVAPPGASYAEVSGEQYAGTYQTSYDFYWSEAYFGVTNTKPTISVTTQNNQALTESKTLTLQGTTIDIDNGNVVTVKYQINTGTARAAQSGVSNGSTPLSFSKVLTYRGGRLYDGSIDVSGLLAEGTNHTVTIWAEDDQGGKSDVVTRTFTVKHNKAPIITVGTFPAVQSGLIPPDSITLSGTASDPDGNTLTVKGKLNSGTDQTLLNGVTSG